MNAQSEPPLSKGIYVAAASDSEKAPLAKILRKEEERGFLHILYFPPSSSILMVVFIHPSFLLLLSIRRITLTLAAEEEEERLNKKILSALQRKLRNFCGTVATESAIGYKRTHK